MGRYVLRRTGAAIATLIAASIVIFAFIHLIPGDPVYVMLGDGATPEQVAALRNRMGLDEPVVVQYLIWAGNALQGDLGQSIFFETPVTQVIAEGAETSILLATITMIWIVAFGVPVGILAAIRQGTWVDQGLSGLAMLLASVPTF
ncbi:MAG: ABC transporter permease, partial [Rhodobacteraceae bacterium]|nr:ABC transporter permease [Paracoccaceae bacterium]